MKTYKLKKIKFFIMLAGVITLVACSDDFLDREPLDSFSETNFFNNSNDLKSYVNGFYDHGLLLRRMGSKRHVNESNTDNTVAGNPNGALNTRNVSGVPPTATGWNNNYSFLRTINILLANTYKVPRDTESRQYTGEAFFARAMTYFDLLSTYGDVPIILEALSDTDLELYRARDPREKVAQQILVDLDSAITNLKWDAGKGRINKKAALHLKTRVGLFEGSWEYYHAQKGTAYAVTGSDGSTYLQAAVNAGDALIAKQGASMYMGSLVEMFQIKDVSTIPGVFFYRDFSQATSLTHDVYGTFIEGTGIGVTKQLVDQFLMSDGLPEDLSAVTNDDTSLRALGQNKDPRLGQTIWTRPVDGAGNTIRFNDYFGEENIAGHAYKTSFPGIKISQQRQPSITGYRPWKGNLIDPTEFRNGETGDIIFRYAEALLNYAEAKAILGTITQGDLDKSVNLLRNRAGMPNMNLSTVNSWATMYSATDGYEVGATNILNEIRRERRVELALEGFRRDDLRRWAALNDVVNGFKPIGAHAQEFLDYWNSVNTLLADEGFAFNSAATVALIQGTQYGLDANNQYFNPFFDDSDFGNAGGGGYFDPSRDYLSPIGTNEIELYQNKGDVTLTQNPGYTN
jgi:hypothetical protein